MSKENLLLLLDELFEEVPGTLTGNEFLKNMEMWDSLTALGYIAMVDEKFHVVVSGDDIEKCVTTNDLVTLISQHVSH